MEGGAVQREVAARQLAPARASAKGSHKFTRLPRERARAMAKIKVKNPVVEMDGEIVLESADNQWIKIKCGKSHFRLACISPDEFPVWPSIASAEARTVELDAATLLDAIEKSDYRLKEDYSEFHHPSTATCPAVLRGVRMAWTVLGLTFTSPQPEMVARTRSEA